MTGVREHPDEILRRSDLQDDPVEQFEAWFADARARSRLELPEAMCLSTVDEEGHPQGRVVLLKAVEEGGFVFYTNLRSPKARHLERRPEAALTFHWEALGRQVRIQGEVEPVDDRIADDYFRTRPRGSQVGAWASDQSVPLEGREELERRFEEEEARFRGRDVHRPPHWSGLRVRPRVVEFWQSRPDRLHDRFRYVREGEGWRIERLSP